MTKKEKNRVLRIAVAGHRGLRGGFFFPTADLGLKHHCPGDKNKGLECALRWVVVVLFLPEIWRGDVGFSTDGCFSPFLLFEARGTEASE